LPAGGAHCSARRSESRCVPRAGRFDGDGRAASGGSFRTRHLGPGSLPWGTMANQTKFRMGRLDHVHIRVPDKAAAAAWYAKHLGFEPVEKYEFWATGFEGGPLQISADGGRTMLALFEASEEHPMIPQQTGAAFSVDARSFISFARSLPGEINCPLGRPLVL